MALQIPAFLAENLPAKVVHKSIVNNTSLKNASDLALHYYENKDYIQALKYAQIAVHEKDARGQFILGILYYLGLGLSQDYTIAFKCFKLATDLDNTKSVIR